MASNPMSGGQKAPARRLSWNDPDVRSVVYQIVALAAVGLIGWFLVSNTLYNLQTRNIASGFDFLSREAGFAIGEGPIPFEPSDTYARAILVGLLNTLRIAVIGIILATILGTIIGIARLSKNWLVAKLSSIYVEVVRNVPLLLQLFFWYAIITETMPGPRSAFHPLPGIFISNRGIKLPAPSDHFAFDLAGLGFLVALVLAVIVSHWARKRQDATGQPFPVWRTAIALVIGLPLLGWIIGGAPLELDVPRLQGFNFVGGATLTPEFAALLAGLVIYTAGFIAEVVRSGIQAVSHGQWEAAEALGGASWIAVSIGGNDLLKIIGDHILNLTYEPFRGELDLFGQRTREAMRLIRGYNSEAPVFVLGLFNPFRGFFADLPEAERILEDWNGVLREAAECGDAVFVPIADLFAGREAELVSDDGLHPNGSGYALIGERIFSRIVPMREAAAGAGAGGQT